MDKTTVKPYEDINRKVYAYTLPQVPDHDGYVKVGETIQETEERIKSQVSTAGLTANLLFQRKAKKIDGTWFRDTDLHRYFELNDIERADFNDSAREWFYFNGYPELAEELTDKFIRQDYASVQVDDNHYEYQLRQEQQEAVDATLSYYKQSDGENREFLWNAKPRFGKTLTAYDFIRKIDATNVLIVTNRPAIANSWFDDFKKFISWQEPHFRFISETDALKNKALSREEFLSELDAKNDEKISQITFISLQDLKGAKFAGGDYEKLKWVGDLNWDLLIIDEAHEGVDTFKTDTAFGKINRDFTLHLSGTPFKALANNKFNDYQIYNWSYVDEQNARENWNYAYGSNPYESLPTLNMFTYQMSRMIEEEISQGKTIGEENYDFTFDLNEFFKVSDGKSFDHEEDVRKFLDNLATGRFPFAETEYRQELNHTLWLLSRVDSAKALEKMLREHPVFNKYEIILAAGDGRSLTDVDESIENEAQDFKSNEKSYDRVKKAIKEKDRTITLSVGQLTTGVTIPEWTGVLMLSNIKSPSLYFQAAFRAQNPHEYVDETGHLKRKENAYIFDFAPERTLVLFDEFANNLSGNPAQTTEERKGNIRELLNFFPVIAEDKDGSMYELDASEVLTIPNRIKATEVVKRGFMSNLLFVNISGIFSAPIEIKDILEKIKPEKNKRLGERREIIDTEPMVDEDGEVDIPNEVIISQAEKLFGKEKIYADEFPKEVVETDRLIRDIMKSTEDGFKKLAVEYNLNREQISEKKKIIEENLKNQIEIIKEELFAEQRAIEEVYQDDIETATEEELKQIREEVNQRKTEITNRFYADISTTTNEELLSVVEDITVEVEEKKKRTTEDDVRDHLRGFARTIPAFLMAYGDKDTKVDNFEKNIEPNTFEELTSITIEEFQKLRDGFEYSDEEGNTKTFKGLFNKSVFNASIEEFFNKKEELSNYFDKSIEEDIFDYIPPQETNQIYTPKAVVKKMVDMLEKENTKLFQNPNIRFIDLYTKSGLFITEIVTRLYEGLKEQIPDKHERLKWIIENQVYAVAPSNIIYNIAKNFIMSSFVGISDKNIVEFDLTELAKEEKVAKKLKKLYGGKNLKFDVVIGNPPYQEMDGGAQASARPVYHHFVQAAKKLNPKYITYIIPTRWYVGGKGLDDFRNEMLNDVHIKQLHDFLTPDDLFPNTNIRGGVCVFLWDKSYNGEDLTKVVTYEKKKVINDVVRPMKIDGIDIFIRDAKAEQILEKIFIENESEKLSEYISPRKPFGLSTNFNKSDKFYLNSKKISNSVICYAKGMQKGYVERHEINTRTDWIDKWKVFTPRANNIGTELPDDNLNTHIGEPNTICTESYIVIGADLNLNQSTIKNLVSYLTTKFVRYLHSLAKASQDATAKTYRFVPLQDFTSKSDIDWTKTISEIDQQLYKKYRLSDDEIRFVENKIKEMD